MAMIPKLTTDHSLHIETEIDVMPKVGQCMMKTYRNLKIGLHLFNKNVESRKLYSDSLDSVILKASTVILKTLIVKVILCL